MTVHFIGHASHNETGGVEVFLDILERSSLACTVEHFQTKSNTPDDREQRRDGEPYGTPRLIHFQQALSCQRIDDRPDYDVVVMELGTYFQTRPRIFSQYLEWIRQFEKKLIGVGIHNIHYEAYAKAHAIDQPPFEAPFYGGEDLRRYEQDPEALVKSLEEAGLITTAL